MGLHVFHDRLLTSLGHQPTIKPFLLRFPIVLQIIAYLVMCFQILVGLVGIHIQCELSPLVIQLATLSFSLNTEKARKLLGYQPIVTMEEGFRRTAQFYKAQRKAKDN